MAEPEVQRVVLIPRFTSFVGPSTGSQTFYLPPMNVRQFSNAQISAWRGPSWGTGSLEFAIEESPDMEHWTSIATMSPSAEEEVVASLSFSSEWIRVSVIVTGGGTGWMVGDFVARER